LGYEELRKRAQRLHFDYRDTGKERNPALKGRPIDMCLVEATGFGDQLIKDLKQARITALPFIPKPYGDKTRRAHFVSPLVEGGVVWLPAQPPHFKSLMPFAQEFERYAALFPKADSRDVIDTMTQALIRLKNGFELVHPHDIDRTPPRNPPKPVKVY
jgi:predicted phage terminase large subunit-like protein